MNLLTTLRDGVLDLLFPPRCEICSTLQEPVVCATCRRGFTPVSDPICRHCGMPLDPLAKTDGCCVECREALPLFDLARSAGYYDGPLRRAVHLLKYSMVRALAIPLGNYMCEQLALPFPLDCLCPVPLHPSRERMRGFNQSRLLADCLAQHWDLPVETQLLARTRQTTPQMLLSRAQRLEMVRGIFTAGISPSGRSIGLIDDVCTTGATLRECSRVLRQAGAARILVLTLARTAERPL